MVLRHQILAMYIGLNMLLCKEGEHRRAKHYHDTQAVKGIEHLGYRIAEGLVVACLVVVDTCIVADNLLNTAVYSRFARC